MFDFLNRYKRHGEFLFQPDEDLSRMCNIPKDTGGIYIVIDLQKDLVLYIGSSGWVTQKGVLRIRDNGMFERIVNGKQFNYQRKKSWPKKMKEDGIEKISVKWFDTLNSDLNHLPKYAEALFIQLYFEKYKKLPDWNVKF